MSSWYTLFSSYLESVAPLRTGDENRAVRPSLSTHTAGESERFFVDFDGELCEKLLSRYGFHLDRTALTTALREDLYVFLLGSPV
jgi:hypothetical protein